MDLRVIAEKNPFQVTVVVPIGNCPNLLEQCLSYLTSQDFALDNLEVLVCDDGSWEGL
jgi:glycosyltransferase involved in cell wall biosynthesis